MNNNVVKILIDSKEYLSKSGTYIIDVARESGIFIPT